MIIESEYEHIVLELGVPGLLLWFLLLGWAFTRRLPVGRSSWHVARRLGWYCTFLNFTSGWIGIGTLTSIPQSMLVLMLFGWTFGSRDSPPVAARAPSARAFGVTRSPRNIPEYVRAG